MFFYTKHKVCFCHIPKTAGMSLIKYFDLVLGEKKALQSHLSLSSGYHLIPKDYRIVFVVRNPYERLVSLKSYWGNIYSDPNHSQYGIRNNYVHKPAYEKSFKEWCKDWLVTKNNRHPQAMSISNFILVGAGIPYNSYVIKFEELESSLTSFMEVLGLSSDHSLPHINKSSHNYYKEIC